jgi:Ran GTPase-activating protein (RanGAP) involved in mRNA processing and transport
VNLDGYALPIKKLKGTEPVELLDLCDKCLGVASAFVIASLIGVNGVLMKLSLARNNLEEGIQAICEALEQNTTLKELDISGDSRGSNIDGSAGAKHVAKLLGVNGALTECNLQSNHLGAKGWTVVFTALRNSKVSKISTWDLRAEFRAEYDIKVSIKSIKPLAEYIAVSGGLTALDLSFNNLIDEGVSEVCEAIQNNKETKLASLNFERNRIGPVGANAVAAMVAVNGALTVANLLRNPLDAESAKMLAEVAKQKGISLCGIRRDQTTADFHDQYLKPPDAILLASDLTQAVVTGGLTSINLSGNHLTNLGTDMTGIKELAAALGVNGGLTKISLAKNKLGEEGTKAICEATEQNTTLKELDISGGFGECNIGGSAGAKHVAKMLGVNGALTVTNLLGNQLDAESAKMLAEVAKQKGISLCSIQHDQTTAHFSNQDLKPPPAVLDSHRHRQTKTFRRNPPST